MFTDLKVKAAIGRLFRAFNRKPSEDAIENFMEFVEGYAFMVVKAAIDREIDEAERMPTPAKIQQNCKIFSPRDSFTCDDCNGKGFLFSEPRHDDFGFSFVKPNHATKCPCVTALAPNHPPIVTGIEVKQNSLARIFARSIAMQSLKHVDDLPAWRHKFWSPDTRQRWIKAAALVGSLNSLANMSWLIDRADPEQCSTNPFKAAAKIIEDYNGKAIRGQGKKMGTTSRQFNI